MSDPEARFRGNSREWRVVADQVHDLALRVARNRTHAADLAQSILKRLVQQGAEVVNVVAWARTALVRLHARRAHRRSRSEPLQEERLPVVSPAAEVRVQLKEILALLPERDRLLLSWWMEGLAHKEIAERLDCRPGDVGTMLSRARSRAKKRSMR
jgi:RNA polymerase sigma factor (sigma-70 family)